MRIVFFMLIPLDTGLLALFCPCYLWGAVMDRMGRGSRWIWAPIYFLLDALSTLIFVGAASLIVPAIIGVTSYCVWIILVTTGRQRIRGRLHIMVRTA